MGRVMKQSDFQEGGCYFPSQLGVSVAVSHEGETKGEQSGEQRNVTALLHILVTLEEGEVIEDAFFNCFEDFCSTAEGRTYLVAMLQKRVENIFIENSHVQERLQRIYEGVLREAASSLGVVMCPVVTGFMNALNQNHQQRSTILPEISVELQKLVDLLASNLGGYQLNARLLCDLMSVLVVTRTKKAVEQYKANPDYVLVLSVGPGADEGMLDLVEHRVNRTLFVIDPVIRGRHATEKFAMPLTKRVMDEIHDVVIRDGLPVLILDT